MPCSVTRRRSRRTFLRFAELGLHVERDTAGWLAHGRRGLSADYWDELAEEWEEQQSGDGQQPDRPGSVGDWGIP